MSHPLPIRAWWSCLTRTRQFRWMSLLTRVYTTQQSTSQHIPYPGTTKLCEWYIWHWRKLCRESTGIYNDYTIKQVSTRTADFCPISPGSDVRCNHGFHMATEFTASRALMSGLSPLFLSPLRHPTICPTKHWPLTPLWQSVHLPFPLSAVMNQKKNTTNSSLSLVNLSTMWTSTKANRNQICKPLPFWWGSSIPVSIRFLEEACLWQVLLS